MTEVLTTRGNYRVVLMEDPDANEPYDEGSAPILCIGTHPRTIEHVGGGDYEFGDAVEAAIAKWGADWHLLEKYLRAFHGVTTIAICQHRDYGVGAYTYIAYDPESRFRGTGLPGSNRAEWVETTLAEYRSWVERDTYGYQVQKLVTYTAIDELEYGDKREWEDTGDSCWGLYGYGSATKAALEALDSATRPVLPA